MLKINVTGILVQDQVKALDFYTRVLGFVKKTAIPCGEYTWLTVVSQAEPSGVELSLEPIAFEPAKVYQQQLKAAGIPCISFAVDNIEQEYKRLCDLGVKFTGQPTQSDHYMVATLDDSCGNYIQLIQTL